MIKERKGPEESATNFSLGTKKLGNNGNMWEIIKTKKGIHRWKRLNNESNIIFDENNKDYQNIKKKLKGYKTYFISSSGFSDIEYLVYKNKTEIYIYTLPKNKKILKNLKNDYNIPNKSKLNSNWAYTRLIQKYNCNKIYIGSSDGKSRLSDYSKTKNNGFLLEFNNHYIYIGDTGIYKFNLKDTIDKVLSPTGSPVIVGKNNIYHLEDIESDALRRDLLPKNMSDSELEDSWYDIDDKKYDTFKIKTKELFKKFYYYLK